jgi:hypothetical protein
MMTSNVLDILKSYTDTCTKNVHGEWEGKFMGRLIFKYTNNKDYYIYACTKENPYSTLSRPLWHWINYLNPSIKEINILMPNTIKCIKEIALQEKLDKIYEDFV